MRQWDGKAHRNGQSNILDLPVEQGYVAGPIWIRRRYLAPARNKSSYRRLNSDRWRLLEIADRIAVRELDYRDPSSLEKLLIKELPDAICHLASTPFNIVETSALEHFDINLSATIGLLEAVRIHAPVQVYIHRFLRRVWRRRGPSVKSGVPNRRLC